MTVAHVALPALTVITEPVEDIGDLLEWVEPRNPLAFVRNGDGIVGLRECLRFETDAGPRIPTIARWWRELCDHATVVDPIGLPGSGLVGFGSFTFSETSAGTSVFSVPSIVVGRRDGVSWITRIGDGMSHELPRPAPIPPEYSVDFVQGAFSDAAFLAATREVIAGIARGEARKVVLARDLIGRIPKMAPLSPVLARLARDYPDTFAFAVDRLVGASPETLVRVAGGAVAARVLAGSAARGTDAQRDSLAATALAGSPKDLAEHAFAVDSLVAALQPHTGAVTAAATPTVLAMPNLLHLATDITATLTDSSSALDLVAALHPTAAVAGTPTATALEIIAELEPFDRGRYAGPVGWVDSNGDGEWAVALRCAQFDEDTVTAFAGAGIVAGSDPEAELAETWLKFRPIFDALR